MRISEDVTCTELVEVVTDYFEGALSPVDRQRFEEHVTLCDGCAVYVEQMRQTIAAVGRVTEDDLSPEVQERLLRAFRDWRRT